MLEGVLFSVTEPGKTVSHIFGLENSPYLFPVEN